LPASPNSAAASPVPVAPTQQSAAVEGAPLKASEPIESAEAIHGLPQGPAIGKVSREARTPGFPSGRLHSRRQDPVAYADGAAAAPRRDGVFAGVDRRQAPEEPASAEPSSAQRPDSNGANQSEVAPNIARQELPPTSRERAEADFREALTALSAGDSARAEEKLRAALSIDPSRDRARQALLGLYVNSGRREEAELLLDERLRVDAKQAVFALALARLQLERGASTEALATLQRSLSFGQSSADYQALLANALGRLSRHREAAERYQAAAGLAPRNPVWLMGMGIELRADSRPSEARAAFQQARELGGLSPQLAGFIDQQLRELR